MMHDVVIAGAGPVGLFLACELGLRNLSVIVLERSDGPVSPLKSLPFGMRGLTAPSTDALYRRGLLETVIIDSPARSDPGEAASPSRAPAGTPASRAGGHFAGIPLPFEQIDTSGWAYRLATPAAVSMPTTMERLEAVLTERALALGVQIRRGAAVEHFAQHSDRVEIQAAGEILTGGWFVGCDGGRSRVRTIGGFDFTGSEPEFTGYSVQVEIDDPAKLSMGRIHTAGGMYFQSRPGTIAMVEFDGGAHHRSGPITLDQIEAVLRQVSGADVRVRALHLATTWTDRARQATAYRQGRVLLAGDAAHIHSPLGGQGLNLGLGDASNLGWKLAAVVRGEAPEALLDTYFDERHPVAARVLDWSRAQVALMRPDPAARALEALLRELIQTRDGATFFAEQLWGVTLRYPLGDPHPLVGRSAPDFALRNGARLGELLQSGKGLWLDFAAGAPFEGAAAPWSDRLDYVASDVEDRLGLTGVLVRPDGVLAWIAEGRADDDDPAAAAARWFGPPR